MTTYFVINRTIGDWNTWFTGTGVRFPNEFSDAKQFSTRTQAEGALNKLKAEMGIQIGDASICEEQRA